MIFLYLLAFVPISLILEYVIHASPLWVFLTSTLAIIPLAEWIRRGTEHLANKLGPSIGGLLNVTFGNAAELILAAFVLLDGKTDVVKGQITGSIIGNSLFGLGLAILIGTWNRRRQTFNRDRVGLLSTMLIMVLISLLLPAIFDFTERSIAQSPNASRLDENLSLAVSVVLILLYIANLIYTLVTHRDVFSISDSQSGNVAGDRSPGSSSTKNKDKESEESSTARDEATSKSQDEKRQKESTWPIWQSAAIMLAATAVTAFEAEMTSNALEVTASMIGVTTFFLGVIVLALIGNTAEYVAGIYFARKQNMSLVMAITVGGTIQVALLVAPLLVIVSYFMGSPMNLVFNNPIELVGIAAAALAVEAISKDGEVTWFEGALLLGVYLLMAFAFFFVTPS